MKKDKTIYVGIIIFIFVLSTLSPWFFYTNVRGSNIYTNDSPIVIITGFEPFDIYEVNPSQLIAETLDGQIINGVLVVGIVLPVDFDKSVENITQAINDYNPVLVISTGLYAQKQLINVENCAVNIKRLPRNESLWFIPRRLDPNGPFIHLATLNTREIVQEIRKENIPVRQSYFAGTYVCNALFYGLTGYIEEQGLSTESGFVHVPLLSSQDPDGMDLETMVEAVKIAIETSV